MSLSSLQSSHPFAAPPFLPWLAGLIYLMEGILRRALALVVSLYCNLFPPPDVPLSKHGNDHPSNPPDKHIKWSICVYVDSCRHEQHPQLQKHWGLERRKERKRHIGMTDTLSSAVSWDLSTWNDLSYPTFLPRIFLLHAFMIQCCAFQWQKMAGGDAIKPAFSRNSSL